MMGEGVMVMNDWDVCISFVVGLMPEVRGCGACYGHSVVGGFWG